MHRGKRYALGRYPSVWQQPEKLLTHPWSRLACRLAIRAISRTMMLGAMMLGATLFGVVSLASGQLQVFESHRSSTSDSARQEALRAIPMANLTARHRQQVRAVTEHATLYRRLPTCVIDCHPGLFTYVARNPEVMVAIWRELGVSHIQLHRTGPNTFDLQDGSGTTGKLVLVEQQCDANAQNRLVMLAEGTYERKPLTRPIKAQCVLLLRSGSSIETNGRRFVTARLDSFIHIDRAGLQLFAKAIHPWVGSTADRNFSDTLTFVSNLSYAAELRPESIGKLARKLPGIALNRRQQLVQIAYQCEDESRQWQMDHPHQHELQRAHLARFTEAAENGRKADGRVIE